jgi:predicted nucleic acid-binding protein
MSVRVYVDTNVWVYARDGRFPTQQAHAQAWLRSLARSGTMVVSPQVAKEHHSVAQRKLHLPQAAARRASEAILAWCDAPLTRSEIQRAFDIEARWKISWWDAVNLASALAAGCTHFLTEDAQSAPTIEGIRIVDPFHVAPEDLFGAA